MNNIDESITRLATTPDLSVWVVSFTYGDTYGRTQNVLVVAKTSIGARKAANTWAYTNKVSGPRDFAAKLLDLEYCKNRAFGDTDALWAASQAAGQVSER